MHKLNASKNAYIEHPIDILQSTERKQLQQTPSSKVGGGGARAARRIRIRRPRLLAAGPKACQTLLPISADSWPSAAPRPTRKPPLQTAFSSPSDPKCQIFGRPFADQKFIKNKTPQKTAQSLKSRTPDRPNIDLGVTFGVHFGIDFHKILDFVIIRENHPNAYI